MHYQLPYWYTLKFNTTAFLTENEFNTAAFLTENELSTKKVPTVKKF
jgi:hypothetical protein